MKVLSITIPCYNSANYMRHCIETLLSGGEDVEIIIVNDGSDKDNTLQIAREYENKNPTIVKVIDKLNGGHGSAVNTGIKNATGKYFKVVDSDDWVDGEVLKDVLKTLKHFTSDENQIDLFLCNFMYDKVGAKNKKIISYEHEIPQNQVCKWNDIKHFPLGTYILMHAIIYRTEILRKCKLELPEHTFYVDNLYAFHPLPYCEKIYYFPKCLYHYFIGRDDQSVNEKVMISRINQQIKVNKLMIDEFTKDENILEKNHHLEHYMYKYLEIITVISSILCNLSKSEENEQKKLELWKYLKKINPKVYKKMNASIFGVNLNTENPEKEKISEIGYKIAQNLFGFN